MPYEFENVDDVLEAFPEAREFADLISASTLEDYASVAKELALKVRKTKGSTSQPAPSPRNPKSDKPVSVSVKDAIEKRNWSGYLSAKWEEQNG